MVIDLHCMILMHDGTTERQAPKSEEEKGRRAGGIINGLFDPTFAESDTRLVVGVGWGGHRTRSFCTTKVWMNSSGSRSSVSPYNERWPRKVRVRGGEVNNVKCVTA
jgi:hypothetical protein